MGKRVVIIGAGVGGSGSAALLAKAGFDVTLLEAHSFHGGRSSTFEQDGFKYDFGVHMFSRGDAGPHGEINRRLGGDLRFITKNPAARVMGKMEFDFPLDIRPLSKQVFLARKLGVPFKNYIGAFFLFRELMGGKNFKRYDRVILKDFVSKYTRDDNIHMFINCLSQLYFAISYTEVSAGEFIWCFTRMFQEAVFGYPAGGSYRIPGSFLDVFEKYNGKLNYGEEVLRIKIEQGRAVGIETNKEFYPADIVISNCGVERTLDLAGRENFPDEYVGAFSNLKYSNAYVTIKYGLKSPVIPYPVVFHMPDLPADEVFRYIEEKRAPEEPYIFMPIPSNIDPDLAPPGKQLIVAGTAAPPGASGDLCNEILDKVHEKVVHLFPGIKDALIWEKRSSAGDAANLTGHEAGEAIGLAQSPDQVADRRPGIKTPVDGLLLVGSDTDTRGIGTEIASGSALRLVEMLTGGVG